MHVFTVPFRCEGSKTRFLFRSQRLLLPPTTVFIHRQPSVVNRQPSVVIRQLSIINYQLSIINRQPSIINYQLPIINCQPSIVNYQLSIDQLSAVTVRTVIFRVRKTCN
jgi:hypothetical protein